MGFFKNISMDVRAQSLAGKLAKIREEQFSCVLHTVEQVLGERVTSAKRNLAGEADLSLKGFQLWILLNSVRGRGYLSRQHADIFAGMVIKHGWDAERDAVRDYCLGFDEHHADSAAQIVQVAVPIADYLLDDRKDPRVWAVIGQTLAFFALQTDFATASEFGDKQTMAMRQSQVEELCRSVSPEQRRRLS
jgi:hypothetical protein